MPESFFASVGGLSLCAIESLYSLFLKLPARDNTRNSVQIDTKYVRIRFHNRFICVGVDISIYVLLTGEWIKYLPV